MADNMDKAKQAVDQMSKLGKDPAYTKIANHDYVKYMEQEAISADEALGKFEYALQKNYKDAPRQEGFSDGVSQWLDIRDAKGNTAQPQQYIEISDVDAKMREHLHNRVNMFAAKEMFNSVMKEQNQTNETYSQNYAAQLGASLDVAVTGGYVKAAREDHVKNFAKPKGTPR